jgi:hypothetical protein
MSAGCLFTDGKHVLAGLQKKNEKLVLSGFGGKVEPTDACVIDAAIRETIEELLGIEAVPPEVVRYIMTSYIPRNQFKNGDYHVFLYEFWDLLDFLHICQGFGLKSPLYEIFPTSLLELILNRKIIEEAEVKELCLLPFKAFDQIADEFLSDLRMLEERL